MDPFGYYTVDRGRRQFEISVESLNCLMEDGTDQVIGLLSDRGFDTYSEIDCIKSNFSGGSIIFFQKGGDNGRG